MSAEAVAQYLRAHPEFLNDHAELLTRLTVPHPQHAGQAISLTERQLHALRDKIQQLERRMAELIRFGADNDDISARVHRLTLALLQARGRAALEAALVDSLQGDFTVPHVALVLWAEGEDAAIAAARAHIEALLHPYCGAPRDDIAAALATWFGEAAAHVRSLALIPLRTPAGCVGALALGSGEPERFYPEMGTLFLERIGALVAAALLQPQPAA